MERIQSEQQPDSRVDRAHLSRAWPFIGRSVITRRVHHALTGVDARNIVLAGELGVGKSRLAQEVLALVERDGFPIARVDGKMASAEIPLGAFAQIIPGDRNSAGRSLDGMADLLRLCAEALTPRSGDGPLILLVDDAHLLDSVSATLVHQLANSGRVRILATLRTSEATHDSIVALWKDGIAERIEVGGLEPESVSEVLGAALDGPVDDATASGLARRAQGNMLFLRELVLGAIENGSLDNDSGIWRQVADMPPTPQLVELVEARLSGLSEQERAIMELVAFGEPLGVEQLEALSDPSHAETLERKGLLSSFQHDYHVSVSLSHPLYGEVIRVRTPAIRTRAIVRDLADAVEDSGVEQPTDLIRVAQWRLMGGMKAPELMLKAAVAARWRFDFPLSERLARAASHDGAGFDADLLCAQLASLQGRSEEAATKLTALSGRAANGHQHGLVALSRLDNRVIYAGDIGEGLQVAADALASLDDPELIDEIEARRLALVLAESGPRKAAEEARPLLERTTGPAFVWACMPASFSTARTGSLEEAFSISLRGRNAQNSLTEPMDWYPWMHHFYEAEALVYGGRITKAVELSSAQYGNAVENGSVEQQAMFSWQLATSVAERGHVEEAVYYSGMAAGIYRSLARPQFAQFCLIYEALALGVGKRGREGRRILQLYDSLGPKHNYFMGVDLPHARAWIEIAEGRTSHAYDLLITAAEEGTAVGDLVGASSCLHTAARIGYAKDVFAPLEEMATSIEGVLAPTRAAHARALAEGDPERLEQLSESYEEMGATLLAAEAASDAAVIWKKYGDQRPASASQRRSTWLASLCNGAITPALQLTGRTRLTAAEWEAAQMAAAGQSNKAIARELVISVRTVENRLQHAYSKLGISSREQLAPILTTLSDDHD